MAGIDGFHPIGGFALLTGAGQAATTGGMAGFHPIGGWATITGAGGEVAPTDERRSTGMLSMNKRLRHRQRNG